MCAPAHPVYLSRWENGLRKYCGCSKYKMTPRYTMLRYWYAFILVGSQQSVDIIIDDRNSRSWPKHVKSNGREPDRDYRIVYANCNGYPENGDLPGERRFAQHKAR